MGTRSRTDTQNKYDPGSMQAFQGMMGALTPTLPGFMTNPFGSPQFGLEQQMGTRQAQGLGQQSMSGLLQNMTASGLQGGASSPAGLEMQQNQGRANTGLQAQLGFMNPMMNALQRQQQAMQLGAGYRPLQTGGTQTQSTGGLGTWLPQMIGAGMGMATGGMGGGISPMMHMFGGGGGGQGGPFGGFGNIGQSGVPSAGLGGGQWGSPMSGWGVPTPPPPQG